MSKKVVHAIYNDDDVLMDAVKKVRAANLKIEEVYTPFLYMGLTRSWDSSTHALPSLLSSMGV